MTYDVAIIGGGIVGLAAAWQIGHHPSRPRVVVLEKESTLASHQTGRNSGVIHSGVYYKPGSMKAATCRRGKSLLEDFCGAHDVPFETCGKVIVATHYHEIAGLRRLHDRATANGVRCDVIDAARLRELEPHASGVAALHVPESGIVDYARVCARLADRIRAAGGEVRTGARVERLIVGADGVVLETRAGEVVARRAVNCAGLHCDRVARAAGAAPPARIIPFRGEYFELTPGARSLCRNLIYPVPDPRFPFLGVHFTRMIGGGVECGPNAVLAFAREGYTFGTIDVRDLCDTLSFPGFWRLAARHWRTGAGEMWRSLSRAAFTRALRRLVPDIREEDLVPAPAGVRAQAVTAHGELVDDFMLVEEGSMLHVLNAPSPAATASLAIGEVVAFRLGLGG